MLPVRPERRSEFTTVTFAKDSEKYYPLPANYKYPYVETKWHLTWRERLTMLFKGTMYLTIMTFGEPLQPIRMSVLRDVEF